MMAGIEQEDLEHEVNELMAEIESLRVKMTKDNVKLAKQRDYYHDAWKEALKEIERMREEGAPRFEGKG
jgi:predicted  nucleic acid-binding Zn-ribbon protein